MKVPDLYVGKQLFVGLGKAISLGVGDAAIRGSAYMEGPTVTGSPSVFPNVWATSMIGPTVNSESPIPVIPGSLCYSGKAPWPDCPANPFSLVGWLHHKPIPSNLSSVLFHFQWCQVNPSCCNVIITINSRSIPRTNSDLVSPFNPLNNQIL